MITIPEIVNQIINKKPFLEESLVSGIINLSALARKLKPEIESRQLKTVQLGAIIMALKRLKKCAQKKGNPLEIFQKQPDMIARSNLIEYTISNSQTLVDRIHTIFPQNPQNSRHFHTFTHGVFETTIITSSEWKTRVEKSLMKEDITGKRANLSSITIILPQSNVITPGVYYYILKSIAWEGINVIDVVSTENEFTIVLDDSDIDHAFSVFKKILESNSR